jgi:hypothetical protein
LALKILITISSYEKFKKINIFFLVQEFIFLHNVHTAVLPNMGKCFIAKVKTVKTAKIGKI